MMVRIGRMENMPGFYYLDVEEFEDDYQDRQRLTVLLTAPELTLLANRLKELGF